MKLGIWLDHSKAYLIEHEPFNEQIQIVYSEHDKYERYDGETSDTTFFGVNYASNNENRKEKRLKEKLTAYYKTLEKVIEQYDEILLFGPTTAKNELKNYLLENKQFQAKKIGVENCDHMSENQLKAYVRNYFKEAIFGQK